MTRTITRALRVPISAKRWVQPKLLPSAVYRSRLISDYAHLLRYREKLLFASYGQVVDIRDSNGAGPDVIHRFYGNVPRWATAIRFKLGIARANYLAPEDFTNSPDECRVNIEVTDPDSVPQSRDWRIGISGGGASSDVPSEWSWPTLTVPISNTSGGVISTKIQVYDEARLIAATAWAVHDGDLDAYDFDDTTVTVGGPILHIDRGRMMQNLDHCLRQGAATLLSWSAAGASETFTSTTYTNPIDSATVVASSTLGFTLQTTRRNTLASSTIPVRLAVFASTSSGTGGRVRLQSASGTLIERTNIGTTAQWYTTDGSISPGETKVDIQARCDGVNTLTLHAVSLIHYHP